MRSELSDQKERVKFHEFDPIYFNWNNSSRIKWLNSIIKAPQYDPLFFLLDKLLTHYWITNDQYKIYYLMQMYCDYILNKTRYLKDYHYLSISDLLPHYMLLSLGQNFDLMQFNEITRRSPIHKLTYKLSDSIKSNPLNLYNYILKTYTNQTIPAFIIKQNH